MKVQVNHNPAPRQLYFNFEEPVLKPVEKDSDIPMYMKQFKDLKAKHPDALLLFRTGDFYTSFEEDAVNAADSLGITLTKSKGFRQGVRQPWDIAPGAGRLPASDVPAPRYQYVSSIIEIF